MIPRTFIEEEDDIEPLTSQHVAHVYYKDV